MAGWVRRLFVNLFLSEIAGELDFWSGLTMERIVLIYK